jgi:hypothetical protein
MDLLSPNPDDFSDNENAALRDALGGDEDQITEFAVIYFRHGKLEVEGPFDRRLAEVKAKARRGRIAERTVTTMRGPWVPAAEQFAEFDKATAAVPKTCEMHDGRCPNPLYRRVQVVVSSGKVMQDMLLCKQHTDQEIITGQIAIADVVVLPLPE